MERMKEALLTNDKTSSSKSQPQTPFLAEEEEEENASKALDKRYSSIKPEKRKHKGPFIQLAKNPLNAWMIAVLTNKWRYVPLKTQRYWFLVIYITMIMQWLSTFGIFAAYLWDEVIADSTDLKSTSRRILHIIIGMVSVFLLWAYVYDQLILVTASAVAVELHENDVIDRGNPYLWGMKFSWLYTLNIWLHVTMIFVATCAISATTGFSDQLQIGLSFYFVLNMDEWIYNGVLHDIIHLKEEEFHLHCVPDECNNENGHTHSPEGSGHIELPSNTSEESFITQKAEKNTKRIFYWLVPAVILMLSVIPLMYLPDWIRNGSTDIALYVLFFVGMCVFIVCFCCTVRLSMQANFALEHFEV